MAETPKLRLYNTLTRTKEDFVPLDPANVRMYVCGPTVYDFAHIGNARPVIIFDVLFRLLRHLYGEKHVTYVRNVTDIDDKINQRAFDRWTRKRPLLDEVKALTDITAAQYEADVAALGNLPPTHAPRATDFVCNGSQPTDMVRVIGRLVDRGFAYAAEGHVLFHVPSMSAYGRLSRRPLDDMIAGARVEVAPYKKDPMDFVLWKPSDPATEPGWDSPWGFGRPGWHIECSAMAGALLGQTFDIHAGGIDLIFPHHENEIAQTCCAFGVDKMASVWMHNGFLQVEGQKMSKSAGNFFTIQDVLKDWPGEVVRLNMLKTHYRQPIDWTVRGLEESRKTLDEFHTNGSAPEGGSPKEFIDALADDLNLPKALAVLHRYRKEERYADFNSAIQLLGLPTVADLRGRATIRFRASGVLTGVDSDSVEQSVSKRLAARRAKNFAESDRIRDELLAMGIQLKDGKDPVTGEPVTTWEVKR
ncbi:MAG: cysteine--tRNA ligase [Methylocystis sp.]|nr:cysteine--tRNA ligase [Methylocystis sp.]MCA3582598.1 cysteine--tRNA ligase [Methylocystis sp.]MCA3589584.1 cysteine--tRNA ligase [Methylocystis sp.]MCA3591729.1 cysteine--tRNA ligase [Methylocystis sp.]